MPNFKNNKGFKLKGFEMYGKPSRISPFHVDDPISLAESKVTAIQQERPELAEVKEYVAPLSEKEKRKADRKYEREGRKRNRRMKKEYRKDKRNELKNTNLMGDNTVGDVGNKLLDSAKNAFLDPSSTDVGVGVEGYGEAINNLKNLKFLKGLRGIYNTTNTLKDRVRTRRGGE
tara:strand:- start:13838 stop:14359 length:522 start_codon:yes stop_codon:yes gene_type:complete